METVGLVPALAGLVTLIGVILALFGIFGHVSQAIAPGSALSLIGGAWLGVSLASRNAPRAD